MTNIYLTGFMGSGKSTVGPMLAKRLNKDFLDLDDIIEALAGTSLTEIFRDKGEPYFRSLETQAIKSVAEKGNQVIALGGGSLMLNENLQLVKSSGTLVYLKGNPETIWERVSKSNKRPLLQTTEGGLMPEKDALQKIKQLLEARSESYNKADVIVSIDDSTSGDVVELLLEKLSPS